MKPFTTLIFFLCCSVLAIAAIIFGEYLIKVGGERPSVGVVEVPFMSNFQGRLFAEGQTKIAPLVTIEVVSPSEIAAAGEQAILTYHFEDDGTLIFDCWAADQRTSGTFLHSRSTIDKEKLKRANWFSPHKIEFEDNYFNVYYEVSKGWHTAFSVANWIFWVASITGVAFLVATLIKVYPRQSSVSETE